MPLSSVVGAQSIVRPGVCTSSTKPASPYDGQVIYMTDVDQTAVWDGSSWVVLAPIASGRNVVINGAMQVAQRGTSAASLTALSYNTADRWLLNMSGLGTWTQSVENDGPTGSGFAKSLKMLCTTSDASPAAGDFALIEQRIEGQNLQQFSKGTSSARQFAVSFWVKSNVTGTYISELIDADNNRSVSASYAISAANTWEKKTIVFPADTSGAFNNDNGTSLRVFFWLGVGSSWSSGTLQTEWVGRASYNDAVGQTNVAAATNNYWQITGVQLEAGAVVTPFEFEDYGVTLRKCQRYYEKSYDIGTAVGTATQAGMVGIDISADTDTNNYLIRRTQFQVRKRGTSTITVYDASGNSGKCMRFNTGAAGTDNTTVSGVDSIGETSFRTYIVSQNCAGYTFHYVASAEL